MKRKFAKLLAGLMAASTILGGAVITGYAEEDVTLSVWYYDDTGVEETYENWAEAVHEQYPNITLEYEVLPYDSGPEKFAVACATHTAPDIYFDGYSRIAGAVHGGLTVDVSSLIEKYADSFIAEQKDGLVDGKYGYIQTANGAPYGIMVNVDLAKELGVYDMLPADYTSWSYDDFLALCAAIKEANPDIIPIDLFAGTKSSDAWYYSWYLRNGSKLTNEDHSATVFNEEPNKAKMLETLNFFKTLIDEHYVPDGAATLTDEDVEQFFISGQMMMIHCAYSNMSYYQALQDEGSCIEFEFDTYNMPNATGADFGPVATWGSYGICGFNDNGHEAEVLQALDVWLADPQFQSGLSNATGRLSAMNNTTAVWPTEHIGETMERGAEMAATSSTSDFGILEGWWTNFRETHYPQLQDFYLGTIDAETFLANWAEAGDAVIAEAQAAE